MLSGDEYDSSILTQLMNYFQNTNLETFEEAVPILILLVTYLCKYTINIKRIENRHKKQLQRLEKRLDKFITKDYFQQYSNELENKLKEYSLDLKFPPVYDQPKYYQRNPQKAVASEDIQSIQYSLRKGNIIDARKVLNKACKYNNLDIVQYLVEKEGVDINCVVNGKTPLHIACKYGNVNIVAYLINHNANIESIGIIKRHIFWVKVLPKIIIFDDSTPLHFAAYYQKIDVVKYLIEKGANVNAKNHQNKRPDEITNNNQIISFLNSL